MKSLKGTRTEKNLLTTFAGESQARNRYTFFASVAKKEDLVLVSNIFTETANQEKEHAERMFKWLEGGAVEITAKYPAGIIDTTIKNLAEAVEGEKEEWSTLYPACAKVADEEGFKEIAEMYRMISVAEKHHMERYAKLATHIAKGTMFMSHELTIWYCTNCGYIHSGFEAPQLCPACLHPKAYYTRLAEGF